PIGIVDSLPVEIVDTRFGKDDYVVVNGYALSQTGKDLGVPFAGKLLQWSLEHPELSLNQVFGTPSSQGTNQSALLRYSILRDLILSPENPKGPSITHLAAYLNASNRAKQVAVERLIQYG